MGKLVRRLLKGGKAQSLVEMAVLAPILLLIVLGIIDLGRVFYSFVTITNAAREGARYGASAPVDYAEIQARVLSEAGGTLDLGPGNSRIQTQIDYQGGDTISVAVSYSFQTLFLGPVTQLVSGSLGGPTLPNDIPISASATMPIMLGNPPAPPPTSTPTSAYISLIPTTGYVGAIVNFTGGNWPGNTNVALTLDGSIPLPNATSDSNGNISGTFTVPAGVTQGIHYVFGSTSGSTARATLNVGPVPTATATGTSTGTATSTATGTATATRTSTPTVTSTPTSTPTYAYIVLLPTWGVPGDRVTVNGHNFGSNLNVTLLWDGNSISTVPNNPKTDASGNFSASFLVPSGSIVGTHVVKATTSGGIYATANYQVLMPTVTSTPTVTPTPTKTPTYAYFAMPTCLNSGGQTYLTINGYNWPSIGTQIEIYFDGQKMDSFATTPTWTRTIGINLKDGVHLWTAIELSSGTRYDLPFNIPCPTAASPTPTATALPDLLIPGISASTMSVPQNQPFNVSVTVKNQGTADANSIFWVDLYIDPTSTPSNNQPGDLWQAISYLAAGQQIQLNFDLPGFANIGTHNFIAQVDTTSRIAEQNENNNLSSTLNVNVTQGAPTPTPTTTSTPTVTATPGNSLTATAQAWTPTPIPKSGSISGWTWIFSGGGWTVPQGRVTVYVYKGSSLIASATSTSDGHYQVTGVPAGGGYTVVGEAVVNGLVYSDTRSNVTVKTSVDTPNINLFLMP